MKSKTKRRILHIALTVAAAALGAAGLATLSASKPAMEKRKPLVSLPVVKAIEVSAGAQPVVIRGEGTVKPLREITLIPEVAGKVVFLSPALVNGGAFKKGQTLLRIDPVDYKLAVTLAEAKVKDAESTLKVVQEEAAAAKEEWSLHRGQGSGAGKEPPPLVAKEPQLAAAEAGLAADRADLKKALLNLSRTEIKAPFDGRVGQEQVDVGQYVAPGQTLASLYSTEAAEILVPLEAESLFWLDVPGFTSDGGEGSPAVVGARVAGRALAWKGVVVRAEGRLDERTRMVNVVVRVENPYAAKPPLAVGLFVTVEIAGHTLPKAALIPRAALHQGNRVWVVEEGNRLRFRSVKVARIDQAGVLIESGLREGDLVVTSPLKSVTDGMSLGNVTVEEGRS